MITDKTPKSGVSVSHFATALLSWGLGPFGFNSLLSLWMLDSIPCGCYQHHLFAYSALLHSALFSSAQLPSAQLDWGSPLPLCSLWYPLTPSLSFSTMSIPCFSAFQHHILEPQLRQMGKGGMVMAEGGVSRADPDNLPSGERKRGKMAHFQGCDYIFFPQKVHDDVHGIKEQISHTQTVLSFIPSAARTHCSDVQTPSYCLRLNSLLFCIALSFLTLN